MLGFENICVFTQTFGIDMVNNKPLDLSRIHKGLIRHVNWNDIGECFYPHHREKHEDLLNAALAIYAFIYVSYGLRRFIRFLDYIFAHPDCNIYQAINSIEGDIKKFTRSFERFIS